jgi:hypothetical protein
MLVGALMSRYFPSRGYLWAGLAASAVAGILGWAMIDLPFAAAGAVVTLAGAGLLVFLGLRPPIDIHAQHLVVGSRAIPWADIRRVDRARCRRPLVVRLILSDASKILVIYPGDRDSANGLLRHIYRHSRMALIEGRPYHEFWGEAIPAAGDHKPLPSPRYRLLRPEDEADVERLYQRLRTVGRLDPKNSADET